MNEKHFFLSKKQWEVLRTVVSLQVWTAVKLMSLVPQVREMRALAAAPRCSLFPALLRPTTMNTPATPQLADALSAAALRRLRESASPSLCALLEKKLNRSQLSAVAAAVVGAEAGGAGGASISLVQGPPGTGKSTTLLTIAGAQRI